MVSPTSVLIRDHVPKFGLLRHPAPRGWLVLSMLLHMGLFSALALVRIPVVPLIALETPIELLEPPSTGPVVFRRLPAYRELGAAAGSPGASKAAPALHAAKQAAARPHLKLPSVVFAAPQTIVSDPVVYSNHIQTIRRPDLINPPRLKFPIRLPSMVQIEPARPNIPIPPPVKPVRERSSEIAALVASTESQPALPIPAATEVKEEKTEPSNPKPEEPAPTRQKPEPANHESDAKTSVEKSVVVVNAVSVPDSKLPIPDAEIAGSFAVTPEPSAGGAQSAGTQGPGSAPGLSPSGAPVATSELAGGSVLGGTREPGAGDPKQPGSGGAGSTTAAKPGTAGNGIGSGAPSGSGPALGPGTGARIGHGSGITILGGSNRGPGAAAPARRYGITIISGGSSGGASRDLGVFSRSDTVYTVYISMADAGGGEDWSLQYCLATPTSVPGSNGLLSPPFAEKKIATVLPAEAVHSARIFIAAVVNEQGALQQLRSPGQLDDAAKAAIQSLAQWHFTPASLNGKPVAVKVLIGAVPQLINSR
jgi:hypothetical protein